MPTLDRDRYASAEGLRRGGYVLLDAPDGPPELILIGSGSEVGLIVAAAEHLQGQGIAVRCVSMPSWELFEALPQSERDAVLLPSVGARLAVELGVRQGWDRYIGTPGPSGRSIGWSAMATDRSAPLPMGGHIDQADGTSWMAMYCLNLMRIALELAQHNHAYEDIATKFFEHFLYIAAAMNNIGDQGIGLWDEDDQFFYDVLRSPNGERIPLKVRSMVGLLPLCAVEILEPELVEKVPDFKRRLEWFLNYRPDLAALVSHWNEPGRGNRRLLSLLRGHRMKRLLKRMLDEAEFLSDFGVRSLSRAHLEDPYVFSCMDNPLSVGYQPAESESGLFGGNSNWRGPIWFPVNYLLVTSLRRFAEDYGPEFRIEYPTGSGTFISIDEVADAVAERLTRLFRRDAAGRRPVFGEQEKFQTDAHFRDYLQFYEYFHGDTGRGAGASHQTGWTGLVAKLLQPREHEIEQTL